MLGVVGGKNSTAPSGLIQGFAPLEPKWRAERNGDGDAMLSAHFLTTPVRGWGYYDAQHPTPLTYGPKGTDQKGGGPHPHHGCGAHPGPAEHEAQQSMMWVIPFLAQRTARSLSIPPLATTPLNQLNWKLCVARVSCTTLGGRDP